MTVASITPVTPSADSGVVSAFDEVAIFQKMIEGFLATGMSLANGFIGDVVDTISDTDEGS